MKTQNLFSSLSRGISLPLMISLVVLSVSSVHAEDGRYAWAKAMGGATYDGGYSLVVDSAGNIYTTGYFSGTADFDPGPGTVTLNSAGGYDIFIAKFDSGGNLVWAKRMGGTENDLAYGISIDSSGNVYATGDFTGTADFDPGPGTFNLISSGVESDIFISKLDNTGNFLWAKALGSTGYDRGYDIAVDSSGNIHACGYFQGTVDFDPGPGTIELICAGSVDVYIIKLDTGGNFVWAKSMGDTGWDDAVSIALDSSGNILTTGAFHGTVDFDPGAGNVPLTSAGESDIFISKLDSSGNFVWAKGIGGTGSEGGQSIFVDASANVYTTGDFIGTVDFDPGSGIFSLTCSGIESDTFISKLDNSGNFVWAGAIGGAMDGDFGYGITVDTSGNIYTTGYFQGTADFDPGPGTYELTSAGKGDVFICKLESNGDFVWAKAMGGPEWDSGESIIADPAGNIYSIGSFAGTADFNPGSGSFVSA